MQYRLESWSEEGNNVALAEELIEGIEARLGGESPSERPGPEDNGNGSGNGQRDHHNHLHLPGEDADALRRFVEGRLFYLTPLPNLMFTRDVGIVVNDQMLLGRMAAPGRVREPVLFDFICRYHDRFRDLKRWSWSDTHPDDFSWHLASAPSLHLEGGNVLQLREDLIILGVGQRTNMESVQRMADAWRAHSLKSRKKLVLYVLRLPAGFNHLDSVLGAISPTECIVYQPVFEPYGPASVDVVRADLGKPRSAPDPLGRFLRKSAPRRPGPHAGIVRWQRPHGPAARAMVQRGQPPRGGSRQGDNLPVARAHHSRACQARLPHCRHQRRANRRRLHQP